MAQALATKYRPQEFENVLGQISTIKILERQIQVNKFGNVYLFTGPSGDGKTTIARILAKKINKGLGEPIEIDGASNNGVEAVRDIIDEANQRAIDSEYKIFLIDEVHMLSIQAWNALLKTIEEPPHYTIFMFCTTNPEKIPETILNRCQRFNLSKVGNDLIYKRLLYICEQEKFINYQETCDYISKICEGSVRQGIAYLEKCANYSTDLSINNALACLGDFSYDSFFNLTGAIVNADEGSVLEIINNYYNSGNDLKLFVESYLDFVLDLTKYCLFKNMSSVKIPTSLQNRCEGFSTIPDVLDITNDLVEKVLNIKNTIKYDVNNFTTIQAMFIKICRDFKCLD